MRFGKAAKQLFCFCKSSTPVADRSTPRSAVVPTTRNPASLKAAVVEPSKTLSPASLKKTEAIQQVAAEKIARADKDAMEKIASIYSQRGVVMKGAEPSKMKTSARAAGTAATSVAVLGAGNAAVAAGLGPEDVNEIKKLESTTIDKIDQISDKTNQQVARVYQKEGVNLEMPPKSRVTKEAAKVGLGVAAQQKLGAINDRGVERIAAIDAQAVKDIDSIYKENNMTMEKPSSNKMKKGNLTTKLAVTGASAAAAKAGMGSLDLARVRDIETDASEQINAIDMKAGDKIAEVYESEGKWYAKPGSSRAAAAAASVGLGLAAVKEIASVEESAEGKMDAIDKEAADAVIEDNKRHSAQMHKYVKKGCSKEFIDNEERTALHRYGKVESETMAKITNLDKTAEKDIAEIYSKKGKQIAKATTSSGGFTTRGATGATATAAAIAAATRGAEDRQQMFANQFYGHSTGEEEKTADPISTIGNGIHLAVYDVGAGVAWAGKSLTGADFEGPPEYDARAHYTTEERAMCCPAP